MYNPITTILSADLKEDGTFEVIKKISSSGVWPEINRIVKEIYGVVDGKITLIKEINGKLEQARVVPERITFEAE
jgi:hypothetical protein